MQCRIHPEAEAVDACRSCGKPLCAACGAETGDPWVCAVCRRERERDPAAADPAAPAEARPGTRPDPGPAAGPAAPAAAPSTPPGGGGSRSPLLAAALSLLPGAGQLYNGEPLKAVAFLGIEALLIDASYRRLHLVVFAAFFWFYQVFEAFHTALRPRAAVPSPVPTAPRTDRAGWALVVAGLLALGETTTGSVLRLLPYALPVVVIGAGIWILLSYFRPAPGSPS